MTVLLECIKNDIRLQYKYGFYYVYLILSFFYILIIRATPEAYKDLVTLAVIFSDPALLGFFFIGALVLLEKSERVLTYLVITPLKDWHYILSKMISLTLLSILSSLLIVVGGSGQTQNIFLLLLAVILVSFLFIGIGFIAVSKFKTVNEYLLTAVAYVVVLLLPVVHVIGLFEHGIFTFWPTYGAIVLVKASFFEVSIYEWGYGFFATLLYTVFVLFLARRLFRKHIVSEGGE